MTLDTPRLFALGVAAAAFLAGSDVNAGTTRVSTAGLGCRPSTSTAIPQPTLEQLDAAGLAGFPLAADAARRDRVAAAFSRSTEVTNPLFPIANLDSAILNGSVDGKPFHTETTLLPFTQLIEWTPGQCVRVLVSQYMAFLDGRLEETAIDLYAQADDGSVWYLGESVFDYDEAGLIITTEGTWHAGLEGPAAMIMPAAPSIGDASRPENIPGTVLEGVHLRVTPGQLERLDSREGPRPRDARRLERFPRCRCTSETGATGRGRVARIDRGDQFAQPLGNLRRGDRSGVGEQ